METTPAQKEVSFFKKNQKLIRPVIILIALTVLFFLIRTVVFAFRYETTDNAQINANIITLRTSVSGTIDKIYFEDNEQVSKGDTLIVFETAELMANLTRAQSQFYSSQLAYQNALENIKGTGFTFDAAAFNEAALEDNVIAAQSRMEQARSDFNRVSNMYEQGAATRQALENAQTQLSLAQAQLKAASNLRTASGRQTSGIGVQKEGSAIQAKLAQANISQAQAALSFAQSEYEKAFITAPYDGIVSNRNVNAGQYVLAGTPLASLVERGNYWVTANFKETQLETIRNGNKAVITIDAFPSAELSGKVESIGGATGAKFSLLPPDNSTGNFIKVVQRLPVRIAIDSIPQGLAVKPGYSVTVSVRKK